MLAWLILGVQERSLVRRVTSDAALLSDTIKSSTYHAMLEDRRDDAYRSMESIGRQEGIERVRFFNKEGRITFSTDPGEQGTFDNKTGEACYACHAADRPLERLATPFRSRVFPKDGHRVLGMVTPIYNEASCSSAACHVHPASQRVLGVVDLSMSLAGIDAQMRQLRATTTTVGTIALVAFGVIVALLMRRSVLQPVSRLVAATRRLGRGDLAYRTPFRGDLSPRERWLVVAYMRTLK